MKNAVFWDVTTCGSCKNRHLGGTNSFQHNAKIGELGTTLAVTSNRSTLLGKTAFILEISSEISIFTRATRHNFPEKGLL
jgi:hypothetical protein